MKKTRLPVCTEQISHEVIGGLINNDDIYHPDIHITASSSQ